MDIITLSFLPLPLTCETHLLSHLPPPVRPWPPPTHTPIGNYQGLVGASRGLTPLTPMADTRPCDQPSPCPYGRRSSRFGSSTGLATASSLWIELDGAWQQACVRQLDRGVGAPLAPPQALVISSSTAGWSVQRLKTTPSGSYMSVADGGRRPLCPLFNWFGEDKWKENSKIKRSKSLNSKEFTW
jgi:hypothetical protein